jgi:predicted nuclease of predicted toxin-antitoxin system
MSTISSLSPSHVRRLGLSEATDYALWDCAKRYGFAIVSQDVDFAEMAVLLRAPPKVIWLRAGNQSTMKILAVLRRHAALIAAFEQEEDAMCLEPY